MTLALTLLTDFPDRFSPMVVKELRQGLRTRLFGGVMLVLHGLLALVTVLAGLAAHGTDMRWLMDGLIGLVLCGIFPLCAFSALAGEMRGNTMDMLVLTRLSAGRIVFGKWAAIVFQALLITVSVVPYFVARYLFGGAELLQDLMGLGFQWLVGAVLTAGVVAVSTQQAFWRRALILMIPLLILMFGRLGIASGAFFGASTSGAGVSGAFWGIIGWLVGAAWLIFALLSLAATRIAPAASLLSVPKRAVHLLALAVLPGLEWLTSRGGDVELLVSVVLVVALVDALTEEVRDLPSLYVPFGRYGWVGRLGAGFLAPGWAHGALYSLLLLTLGAGLVGWIQGWHEAGRVVALGSGVTLCALIALGLNWLRRVDLLGGLFVGAFLIYALTLFIFLLVIVSKQKEELQWLALCLPSTVHADFFNTTLKPVLGQPAFLVGVLMNLVWPLLLAGLAWARLRVGQRVREEAWGSS